MNAALHVVVVKNEIAHEGELADCIEFAKANGGTIKTARSWTEQQARLQARTSGEQATQTVKVLLSQGVVPIEEVFAAVEILRKYVKYSGGKSGSRTYPGYAVVKLGMKFADKEANASLTAGQMAWLVKEAASVRAAELAREQLGAALA